MILGRFNNWVVLVIIFCSTALYKVSALGSLQEVAELAGVGLMVVLMIIYQAYAQGKPIRKNFILPVSLIILSILTSMVMANYSRNQPFVQTIIAQRAMYYYFLYFLLHQLKIKPKDLEWIFVALGILYVAIYLLQFTAYPKMLFDGYVRSNRGTIRIYLPGFSYMIIAFFFGIQYFFRTNKMKYLLLVILTAIIFILIGGRQTLASIILITVAFLIFDQKIKSRFFIGFLGIIGVFAIFLIFQGIFEAILKESRSDANLGEDYIRLKAAEFFLTDFFKSPIAYITGNGMFFNTSSYGKEILYYTIHRSYTLGDIGIFGNYAIYGAFFLIGVLIICYRALKIKIETGYTYIKLMFVNVVLSIIMGGGFAQADFICSAVLMLYMIDVSKSELLNEKVKNNDYNE